LRTLLFWLASLFLITVSGNLTSNLSHNPDHSHAASFTGIPQTHFIFDNEARESLNEFEEEDERIEESEKHEKRCALQNSQNCCHLTVSISEAGYLKFHTYDTENTYTSFLNHSVKANAPPVIS
jgi:hypothetical protein